MPLNRSFSQEDLSRALTELDVPREKLLVVISDLERFGDIEHGDKSELQCYVDILQHCLGDSATLVVPTFTYNRGGPESPYIHETSISKTGALTEYIRRLDGAVRSLHPVFSFAAIGGAAAQLCENVSQHSYGADSTAHRLFKQDAFVVALGLPPHRGGFFIHLAEVMAGVPYRFTKELSIPVYMNGEQVERPFFHFVKYPDADIEWDTNRLVARLDRRGLLRYRPLGASGIWAYRASDLVNTTLDLLMRNIYGLLAKPPEVRPWNA